MPRHLSAPPAGVSLSPAPVASAPRTALEGPSNAPRAPVVARVGVGYLRRSTDRQEQSIGDQRAAVERFAAERGVRLLRHYIDDGISGTSTAGHRAFQQLIADAERIAKAKQAHRGAGGADDAIGGFDVVVCYDVKRFGRVDNDEAGYYRHILKRCGVEVMYASEGFTGGMVDDLLRPVKQWQARQESKDLAKVVIRGLVSKATPEDRGEAPEGEAASGGGAGCAPGGGGWWMGGAPPLGYDLRYESMAGRFIFTVRYRRDGTKLLLDESGAVLRELAKGESVAVSKRDRCRLTLGEASRVRAVKEIFRMYAEERKGFKAIASALNRAGVETARSKEWAAHYSGRWSITTVRAILLNPAYCGDMAWNRRTDARFYRIVGGRAIERELSGAGMAASSPARRLEDNDEADWIVTRDAHEPIVSRSAWEKAREIIRSHDKNRPPTLRVYTPRSKKAGGGGGWGGERTKYLLSGLVKCGRCGNSYEGRIDRPSKANASGGRSKSYSYVCGGYIRQGKSVCSRGRIAKGELEQKAIEEVIKAYRPFMGRKGRKRLEAAMLEARGGEANEAVAARRRASTRLGEIAAQARTLLDNLSEANRAFVDERLKELTKERGELELRVESLDRLAMSDRETQEAVREEHGFIESLEAVLHGEDHEVKRAAVERCTQRIAIESFDPLSIAVAPSVHSCNA